MEAKTNEAAAIRIGQTVAFMHWGWRHLGTVESIGKRSGLVFVRSDSGVLLSRQADDIQAVSN